LTNYATPIVYNATEGRYGGAFEFDGGGDYVDCGSGDSLIFTGAFTVSTWVNLNVIDSNPGGIVSNGHSSGYILFYASNYFKFYVNSAGWKIVKYPTTPTANQWYHVVGRYDGSDITIYVNGIQGETLSVGSITDYSGVATGIGVYSMQRKEMYFNGLIDEVAIYNRSLSSDEIYQQYVSNLNKYDTDKWALYVNQSLNASDGLPDGAYT
ncbi:unnamed protein product, partial [marine sediment metagenome]